MTTASANMNFPSPSKSNLKDQGKKKQYRLMTVIAVSMCTLAIYLADYFILELNSETHSSWPGMQTLKQAWNDVLSSNLFAFDCTISMSLLAFLTFQLGYRKPFMSFDSKAKKGITKSKVGRVPLAKTRHGSNQCQADADCGSTSRIREDTAAYPVEKPVSRVNQAIDFAARQGDVQKACSLLLEFERQGSREYGHCPDIVSYNLVIRAFAKKGDYKGAQEWIKRAEFSGLTPNLCSYNTVLDACTKADNPEACESWLKTLLDKGIEASAISYATVIYARARRGEEALAEAWLRKMITAGILPDSVCYNSMIHACGVNGNSAGAEHWMEEMRGLGLEASVTTFTAVIDACAKGGDVPRAEKWLEAMISSNIEPNVVSFSAMIDACAKAADATRAIHWHDRMLECNIKPNCHSFSAVINACAKAGDVVLAEEWLGKSEEAGIANDVVVYSSMIDACGKAGDAERAMLIFERMQEHGIRPHIVAYAALARPFSYRGDWKSVERIAQDMAAGGIRPNEYFLYAQLLSYANARPRHGDRAEQCFRDSLRLGLKANDHVVGALLRATGRERTAALMEELCQGRPLPEGPPPRPTAGNSKLKALPRRHN